MRLCGDGVGAEFRAVARRRSGGERDRWRVPHDLNGDALSDTAAHVDVHANEASGEVEQARTHRSKGVRPSSGCCAAEEITQARDK